MLLLEILVLFCLNIYIDLIPTIFMDHPPIHIEVSACSICRCHVSSFFQLASLFRWYFYHPLYIYDSNGSFSICS
jgi:hypothetical protein